jgi:fructose 1,6-bisphosphate aldolase/phosphatase
MNIMDVEQGKVARLELWQDKPTIEAALMYPGRYVVDTVTTKDGEPILSASTDRLHNIAGVYVGKDDPICLVRTQKMFPATEEVGSVFNNPHYVAGNTRGSHNMPLMPVKLNSAATHQRNCNKESNVNEKPRIHSSSNTSSIRIRICRRIQSKNECS